MSTHEIEAKIKELRQLQSLIEEAQAEAESIKDVIKSYMGDSTELHVGEYKVTWKEVISKRFDSTAFRKACPELAAAFYADIKTRRFCVS